MKSIWKYKLEITDEQSIEMPKGSKVLSVGVQDGVPVIWAEVDLLSFCTEKRVILIFGTGNPIDGTSHTFVGTFQLLGFVGHVFVRS